MAILRRGQRTFEEVLELDFDLVVGDLRALAVRFKKHDERTHAELLKAVERFHGKVKTTTKQRCRVDTGFMQRNVETRAKSSDGFQQETGWWRDTFETRAVHAKFRFYAPYPELKQHSLSSSFYTHADSFAADVSQVLKRGERRMERGQP